jgi:hypothetical protein
MYTLTQDSRKIQPVFPTSSTRNTNHMTGTTSKVAGDRALSELAQSDDGDLLLGVVIWSLTDWQVPSDLVDWSVAGRPVEEAIQLWFCGKGQLNPVYTVTSSQTRSVCDALFFN